MPASKGYDSSIVISGLGLTCPLGYDLQTVTERLRNQEHGFSRIEAYSNFKGSRVSIGAQIPGFDTESPYPEDWTSPNGHSLKKEQLKSLNPHTFFALHALEQALDDAKIDSQILGPETGLFTASAGSSGNLRRNLNTLHEAGVNRTNPMGIVNSVVGTLTYNLSSIFSIQGHGCGFASACASSAHALGFALDQIRLGRQERMIVVGAEDGNLDSVLPFAGMHALSTSKDINAASLPFDKRRTGFVGAGGAAVIILETAESAEKRGAKPYAELLGWGQSSDGHKPAAPHPEGEGLMRAMAQALDEAGVRASEVEHINAHATGTYAGDLAEALAISKTFIDCPDLTTASTKSLTGHTLSMAGALEVTLELLAQQAGFTPGTANLDEVDPKCDLIRLPKENLPNRSNLVMSNSSGFGGANVSIIFKHAGK